VSALRVCVTGATGLIGSALLTALRGRGAQVTVLSRDPSRVHERLGSAGAVDERSASGAGPVAARSRRPGRGATQPVEAVRWDPLKAPAPAEALAGCDAVVHLAGENVAQRWTAKAREAIRESRSTGTRHLVEGLRSAEPRPRTLVSASAIGYYGAHGGEPLDEDAPAGKDFLAAVCADWELEAERAAELGVRVVLVRTGVVLDRNGGALAKMLIPFRLGVGGPVAGGRQYMSWIHRDDLIGMILAAIEDERWTGPINATAPEPVSNRDFSRALGSALGRPSRLPVPGAALRLMYGEMAAIVTTGARVVPAKPLVLGYEFRHPRLPEALRSALTPG
jgi:uncharacterized protein (TIGR01777 family)